MNEVNKTNKKVVAIVSGILTLIPFIFLMLIPTYNKTEPELGGLSFFYWYQLVWLIIAAILFYIAAHLWNKYGGE